MATIVQQVDATIALSGDTMSITGVAAGNTLFIGLTGTTSGSRSFAPSSDIDGAFTTVADDNPSTSRISAMFALFNASGGNHTVSFGWPGGVTVQVTCIEVEADFDETFIWRQYTEPSSTNSHQMVDPTDPMSTSGGAFWFGVANLHASTGDQTALGDWTELTSPAGNQHYRQYIDDTAARSNEYGAWQGSGSARLGQSTVAAFPYAASGVTGTAAAEAPPATASVSGTPIVAGSAAATAAAADVDAAGTPAISGAAAAQAPTAAADAAGAPIVSGSGDTDAPAATAAAQGTPVVTGTADASAPPATADANDQQDAIGTVDASAPAASASASGTPVIVGSAAGEAPAAAADASGAPVVAGQVAADAPAADAQVLGTVVVPGAIAADAPAASASAAGTPVIAGSVSAVAPAATVDADEVVPAIPDVVVAGTVTRRQVEAGAITGRHVGAGTIRPRRVTAGPITQRGQS